MNIAEKQNMRKQILAYALRYQGDWNKIAKAIAEQEHWTAISYPENYVTVFEEAYPQALRNLQFAPWILFYRGDLSLTNQSAISVVGSRNPDEYALRQCQRIVNLLKPHEVIISGLAKGIDGAAHQEALSHRTIGVIGCGLDIGYPKVNRQLQKQMEEHHLVLSEYPNGVKPLAFHFPWRNRILAALGRALIVVAAAPHSGTMLTVNEALACSRPVYCVPHAMDSPCGLGCNLLISQGAFILCEEDDIANI